MQREMRRGAAADADAPEEQAEDLLHVYEPLAQTCSAIGLHALAAVFYGLCVHSVACLPPAFVIDESALANDTAPRITAARFVPMMLNQQANELTSAGDYAAALQALAFSRATATAELEATTRRAPSAAAAARLARDADELHGILAYCLSQCSACVLELCNRHGLSELAMPVVSWLPAEAAKRRRRCNITVKARSVVVPLSPAVAAQYVQEALSLARNVHIDSYLQSAFSLGDLALSRYDLDEAMRIFSLVALVSAHGQVLSSSFAGLLAIDARTCIQARYQSRLDQKQVHAFGCAACDTRCRPSVQVQHFNLTLQSHSFRAMAALNAGNAPASLAMLRHCLVTYGFSSPPVDAVSPAAFARLASLHDDLQMLCATAPRYDGHGCVVSAPAVAPPAAAPLAEHARAVVAAVSISTADTPKPSTSGQAAVAEPSAATPPRSGGGAAKLDRRVDGVTLRYERGGAPYEQCHEQELVARLQAHMVAQGHHIAEVMEMVRMRMMELYMRVRPPLPCLPSSWPLCASRQ